MRCFYRCLRYRIVLSLAIHMLFIVIRLQYEALLAHRKGVLRMMCH